MESTWILSSPTVFFIWKINKNMKKRQIDHRATKQVRIDIGMHKLLKLKATRSGLSIKTLLEGFLAELLAVES